MLGGEQADVVRHVGCLVPVVHAHHDDTRGPPDCRLAEGFDADPASKSLVLFAIGAQDSVLFHSLDRSIVGLAAGVTSGRAILAWMVGRGC